MALCSIDEACKVMEAMVGENQVGNILPHVHFYGVGGTRGAQLKEKLEEAIGSLIVCSEVECIVN